MNRDTQTHAHVQTWHRMGLADWHGLGFHDLLSIASNSLCGSGRKDIQSCLGGAGEGMANALRLSPHWCHGEMHD